ncbi:hypothetical protein CSUB01_09940 [Colletotrichum sublineola]|uniref:Uncharacterized protein n=1 Tax=Colletotrichum sublineola TaxID=1173701 RepID=A0A066X2Q9_COLSU|nr:hypothetical protein CSUB01_09940 [Colletotrichum sublineola]
MVRIYDLVPGGKYQELIDTDGVRPKTTPNLVLCPEYLARVRRLQIQIMEQKGTPHGEDLDQVAIKQFEIYTLREMGLADDARPNLDWDAKFKEWMEDKSDFNEWLKSQEEMAEPSIRTSVTAAAMGEHIKRKAEADLMPEEGNKRAAEIVSVRPQPAETTHSGASLGSTQALPARLIDTDVGHKHHAPQYPVFFAFGTGAPEFWMARSRHQRPLCGGLNSQTWMAYRQRSDNKASGEALHRLIDSPSEPKKNSVSPGNCSSIGCSQRDSNWWSLGASSL